MLTPTGVTSSAYWSAIKAGNPTHVQITFLGQNIVLDDSDIAIAGINIVDLFNSDTDIVFGKAVSKQVEMNIINSSKLDGLIWTGEFTLEFGVDIGNPAVTYWVNIGYFTGLKPKNVTTVNVINFIAYDRMTKFDQLADSFCDTLTYPITVQGIYDALCANVGVSNVAGDELPDIMSRSFASAPVDMKGYTCRDILSWIAESCGCYARITADGECKMIWFTDNTSHAITGDEEFNVQSGDINDAMIWNEADTWYWNYIDNLAWDDICGYQEAYSIDQIQVKLLGSDIKINYPYEYGGNVYTIVDNPFLTVESTSDITNYIAPLYNRMDSFGGYVPASVDCVGCWLVESGDIVSVDINGSAYSIPIFVRTMKWNGAVDDYYETTGNRERSAYADDKYKQASITSKYIRLFVEDNYYHTRSGIAIEPNGVIIDADRYIKMLSGSSIDIESGADINVRSGGNIDVESGANINIKSGGNMNFESGGSLDIKSGGSMYIRAGGVLDVQSTNFIIDSTNKIMSIIPSTIRKWQFDINGLSYYNTSGNTNMIRFGTYTYPNPLPACCGMFMDEASYPNNGTILFLASDFANGSYMATKLEMEARYNGNTLVGHYLTFCPYELASSAALRPRLGKANAIWRDIYTIEIHGGRPISDYGDLEFFVANDDNSHYEYLTLNPNNYQIHHYGGGSSALVFHGTVSSSSSRSIKHDITYIQDVGDIIDKLKPVTFIYDTDVTNRKHYGLIYEETIDIVPEMCSETTTKDGTDKSLNYVELVPILLKEIQNLRTRVKALEEREVV